MLKPIHRFFHKHYHSRYRDIYRHAKKLFVFDLALLGLALAVLSYGLYLTFWQPSLTDFVDLSLSFGEERVESGQYVHLTLDYTNRSKENLDKVVLGLRLPPGFVIDRDRTGFDEFSDQSVFLDIKQLPPGSKGQVGVYGWLWAEPNEDANIIASLTYQPETSDRKEQKLRNLIARLPRSLITADLTMASSSIAGQSLPFKYSIKNTSDRTVRLNLELNWPGLVVDSQAKAFDLKPNEEKKITGQLQMPIEAGDYDFTVVSRIKINNQLIRQTSDRADIEVVRPQVSSQARFLTDKTYAEPGDVLPVEISWRNNGSQQLNNLKLRLTANYASVVDWAKTAAANRLSRQGNGLLIDSSTRTKLSDGNPGGGDQFTIDLYLSPSFNLQNAQLEIIPTMEVGLSNLAEQIFQQAGSPARINLATEVSATAEARYYTIGGDQLGRGPLPPRVNEITKYWIFFQVNNTTNPLQQASFSVSLPAGVEPTERTSVTIGQRPSYDQASRQLSWSYSRLPANSQTGIYFEVAVTPSAEQAGSRLQLTNGFSFSAQDEITGKRFDLTKPALYNILNANDRGSSQGHTVTF